MQIYVIFSHKANKMNEISLTTENAIAVESIDLLTANTPFVHIDRIAKYNVLIYVLSGCIYVSEDGQDLEATPGDLILLKQGTHHYGTKPIEAGTSWIYAHFYIGDIKLDKSKAPKADSEMIFLPKVISGLENTDIPNRLKKLISLSESNKTLSSNRVSSHFHNILLDIHDQANPTAKENLTDQLLDYLQDKIYEDLSSSSFEQKFHLTYKHLTRLFSKAYGLGLLQYHNMLRLQEAAKELRSTNKSVSLIAADLNYSDSLYFSKCFKKQYGASPREYRRSQLLNTFMDKSNPIK